MKKFILPLVLLMTSNHFLKAQSLSDTTMIVNGVCMMCEDIIEKAAKIEGVSLADWELDNLTLTLKYDPQKVSLEDINKSIVASGYDTEFQTASDSAYYKLDPCCYYRDPNNSHKKHKKHK